MRTLLLTIFLFVACVGCKDDDSVFVVPPTVVVNDSSGDGYWVNGEFYYWGTDFK